MNNEPVAWMSTTGKNFVSEKAPSYVKRGINGWIPLYTHTVKKLTDEEIMQVWWNANDITDDDTVIEFARAILKKAQEK